MKHMKWAGLILSPAFLFSSDFQIPLQHMQTFEDS